MFCTILFPIDVFICCDCYITYFFLIEFQRVKVYRLNDDGKWDDQGTGHVTVDYLEVSTLYIVNNGYYINVEVCARTFQGAAHAQFPLNVWLMLSGFYLCILNYNINCNS